MRNNRKNNVKKERIIMLASSAFVLTALTMTGIYMQTRDEESKDEGYTLDFTALEDNAESKYQEIARNDLLESEESAADEIPMLTDLEGLEDDLDYMPLEAGSGKIELPGLTDGAEYEAADDHELVLPNLWNGSAVEPEPEVEPEPVAEPEPAAAEPTAQPEVYEIPEVTPEELHYAESDGLLRPVEGEVLIPFSMDGSVYFSTLDQYKYNPAMMLVAQEGTDVLSCAEGRVVDIFENAEIGRAVTVDLGDGYRITYGQLKDLNVSMGSFVHSGDTIGKVAAPTKYYSIEGANLYLKLTADGTPVNPEALFR
ncbi:MAG: M23 family metallopeptidase [bacterium]|nr:M23 family metallopeptidase [bacterium]